MPSALGALRRFALSPAMSEVTFARRGFPGASAPAAPQLETIPQAVICGFEWGIEVRQQQELASRLDMVAAEVRGFAYEGATMACTIRDATGRGRRTRDLLDGPGRPHLFLAYIGIGFAMARLPRPLWPKVLPDLSPSAYHPTMSWLAIDGYGFDRAYFDTRRWVDEQHVPRPHPWQDCPEYFQRAADQGIGRALWFIHGARVDGLDAAVRRFAEHRRADLWSGVGLAATFAGGCDATALKSLVVHAGEHRDELALGAVFAAKARDHAGFRPPHTEIATTELASLSVDDAVRLADDTAVHSSDQRAVPPYELWRANIRSHLPSGPPR